MPPLTTPVFILPYYTAKYKNDLHHQTMYVQQTMYTYIIHSSLFMMKEALLITKQTQLLQCNAEIGSIKISNPKFFSDSPLHHL